MNAAAAAARQCTLAPTPAPNRRYSMCASFLVPQMIGRAFGEADLLQLAHVYEQTADVMAGMQPPVFAAQQA